MTSDFAVYEIFDWTWGGGGIALKKKHRKAKAGFVLPGSMASVTIENFKGVGDAITVPLKPITLLFGEPGHL